MLRDQGWSRKGITAKAMKKLCSEHPLTDADLTREKTYLKADGVDLIFSRETPVQWPGGAGKYH